MNWSCGLFPKLKLKKSLFWMLIGVSVLFLSACGQIEGSNWPGVTANGDIVYVSYQGNVTALDMVAERQVWQYANTESNGVNFYAPVSVVDDTIVVGDNGVSAGIFAGGGFIVGIHSLPVGETSTPQARWVSNEVVSGRVFAEALQMDGKIFFGTADNHFVALNGDDGSKVWDFATGNAIWSQPAYHNNRVYFSSLDKNVYALDADTGDLVWQAPLVGASAGSPVVNEAANLIYVGSFDGLFHAFDLDSGEEVWSTQTEDWIWGTAALDNDVVYFADMAGHVLAHDAVNGEQKWAAQVPESARARPVVYQGVLFVASGDVETNVGYLTALSLDDGNELWQVEAAGALNAKPAVTDAGVAVAFADAEQILQVILYDIETGDIKWTYTPPVE